MITLDTTAQNVYDNQTTKNSSGYPHPLYCGFFVLAPLVAPTHINLFTSYDGSREPNTTPLFPLGEYAPPSRIGSCSPSPYAYLAKCDLSN